MPGASGDVLDTEKYQGVSYRAATAIFGENKVWSYWQRGHGVQESNFHVPVAGGLRLASKGKSHIRRWSPYE
jgi:hypothetical protein